jgi:hypothetical protein
MILRSESTGAPCEECLRVLRALNELTGRSGPTLLTIKSRDGTREYLHQRHKEYGVDACLRVVAITGRRMMRDPKMSPFCRPDTLFRPKNFPRYLEELPSRPEQTADEVTGFPSSRGPLPWRDDV